MNTFVTHDQLLIILIIVLLGAGIFAFAMLKHAIELRQKTTQVIEDLSVVQTYIDVELAAKFLEQQAAITLISDVQQLQGVNLEKLNENSNITYSNTFQIVNGVTYNDARLGTTLGNYNYPLL